MPRSARLYSPIVRNSVQVICICSHPSTPVHTSPCSLLSTQMSSTYLVTLVLCACRGSHLSCSYLSTPVISPSPNICHPEYPHTPVSFMPLHDSNTSTCSFLSCCTCFCPQLSYASVSHLYCGCILHTHVSRSKLVSGCSRFHLVTLPSSPSPRACPDVHCVMQGNISMYILVFGIFSRFLFGSHRFIFTRQRTAPALE